MPRNTPTPTSWGVAGQTIVVTGAAAGIGAAVAEAFAAADARVFGLDIAWGEGVREPDGASLDVDVTDPAEVRSAIARVTAIHGSVDVLVNSAGIMRARESFFDFDVDDWRAIHEANVVGTYNCMRAIAPGMQASKAGGAIVNIASVAGRRGQTLSPPYAASKAAVINLTRSAAVALAAHAIRVNAVAPGIIDTEMSSRPATQVGGAQGFRDGEFTARRIEDVPLGRIGSPHEVAHAVLFLASPHAAYVTGQTLNVDGGLERD